MNNNLKNMKIKNNKIFLKVLNLKKKLMMNKNLNNCA